MEKDYLEAAPLRICGGENAFTKRYYAMVLKWLRYPLQNYHTWPNRPNCGYFFSGCGWYGDDQNSMAAVAAVLSKMGSYDETAAGISRKKLRKIAVQTLRYACFTHDTGPEDCVRADGKNKLQANTKWGGNYVTSEDSRSKFFQGTQVGTGLAMFGIAAWFLWEDLDEETKRMCYRVITDYAERWADYEPREGVYYNTQCEENAWTASGIAVAAHMFPTDPRAEKWKNGCISWMLDSASIPTDQYDTSRLNDGTRLCDRLDHITFHPDFTTENHGIVHPDYMLAALTYRVRINLFTLLSDGQEYPGLRCHWKEIYDQTLKIWAASDGGAVPVQSQDWWYYKTSYSLTAHTATNLLFHDREAAYLEEITASCAESVQNGNESGCFIENDPTKCIVNARSFQDIGDMEISIATHLLTVYLYHYILGMGELPASRPEFEASVAGVHSYPFGGSILKRTEESFSCFSWRNSALAFVLPRDLIWTITTPPCSVFGTMEFRSPSFSGAPLANEMRIHQVTDEYIERGEDSFSASARIQRGFGAIRQDVAFCALPTGDAVYFEQVKAEQDCELSSFRSGLIGIRNEHYPLLPEHAKGYRDLYVNDSAPVRMKGYYGGEQDDIYEFDAADYIAVDDKMAYLTRGSSGVTYVGHHVYPKWKGVEDFLILNNHKGKLSLSAGEELPPFLIVFLPNQSIEEAKKKNALLQTAKSNQNGVEAVLLDQTLVYHSNRYESVTANLSVLLKTAEIPVLEGVSSYRDGILSWNTRIPARKCGFAQAKGNLVLSSPESANLRMILEPSGNLILINEADCTLDFTWGGQSFTISAGSLLRLNIADHKA